MRPAFSVARLLIGPRSFAQTMSRALNMCAVDIGSVLVGFSLSERVR